MPVINTNVSSLIAQNALTSNSRAQSNSMQQLSTGLRINSAKDDAAGMAIASKMTSQIKGLDQAVRNANDAVSMLQTADGALIAVSDMLQRMRELATQSASETNVTSDRTALQDEFKQLRTEIDRISKNTQWNGMNVLDGSHNSGKFSFQVGANAGQTIDTTIDKLQYSSLDNDSLAVTVTTSGNDDAQTTDIELAATSFHQGDTVTLNLNGHQFQYSLSKSNADDATAAELANGGDGILAVAGWVNDALTAAGETFGGMDVSLTDSTFTIAGNATATPHGYAATASTSGGGLAKLQDLDISNDGDPSAAITGVSDALAVVNSQRSGLGAVINRLTYAADNLSNVSQNASASRSRIQDTDYAKASTELARTQIISQAATAMLAQANQSQQSVLALLK